MPSEDNSLASVLKALLSTGEVTIYPEKVYTPGFRPVQGFRLVVNSSVVLDGSHVQSVRDACGIAIDDAVPDVPADSPMRCGCRETYAEYLVQGCPLHDPALNGGA